MFLFTFVAIKLYIVPKLFLQLFLKLRAFATMQLYIVPKPQSHLSILPKDYDSRQFDFEFSLSGGTQVFPIYITIIKLSY